MSVAADATQMQLGGFDGRTALVTGAGRGIGRRIAETLSALGSRTAGGDLEAPQLDGVLGVALDVTSEESVDRAFTTVEEHLGAVDIVVLLLTPAGAQSDALNVLSCIARRFRDDDLVGVLRAARTQDEFFALLLG